jgi:hypothetical protein
MTQSLEALHTLFQQQLGGGGGKRRARLLLRWGKLLWKASLQTEEVPEVWPASYYYMSVLILLLYVSSYYCMCLHTTICVLILLCVSSYYCICVLVLLHTGAHRYTYRRMERW